MLLNAPYPSDVRIKKETDALQQAGFQICLLCLRRAGEKYQEQVDGIGITRIDAGKNDYHLAFWDVIMSISFIHPRFKSALPEWVRSQNIGILHVHDLPLIGTALALRDRLKIKVVADFHENYPEGLRTWFEWKRNPIARLKNYLFMNPTHWEKHERVAATRADHVIAVVEEMKGRLMRDHNIASDRITVVTNSEGRDFLQQPDDPEVFKEYNGKFIIAYTGNIGPHRGVDTVIHAMSRLQAYPQIVLLIIGSGSKPIMRYLEALVAKYQLANQIKFFGRQPFHRFFSFMKYASANIIPHKSNGHTDHTVPHKLFQAMMVGKPVIVSDSAPLKRIVEIAQSGLVFEADNSVDLSKKIVELYQDNSLQERLGRNGIQATGEKLNWETDQQKLVALYREMFHARAEK